MMEQTIKAILARFHGDSWEAIQYCFRIAEAATNPYLKREYEVLAVEIRLQSRPKAEGAHA